MSLHDPETYAVVLSLLISSYKMTALKLKATLGEAVGNKTHSKTKLTITFLYYLFIAFGLRTFWPRSGWTPSEWTLTVHALYQQSF